MLSRRPGAANETSGVNAKGGDHLRAVEFARVRKRPHSIGHPDIRGRAVEGAGVPEAACGCVPSETDVIPAHRRAQSNDGLSVRRTERLLLKEVIANVDLDHWHAVFPPALDRYSDGRRLICHDGDTHRMRKLLRNIGDSRRVEAQLPFALGDVSECKTAVAVDRDGLTGLQARLVHEEDPTE